MDTKLTNFSSTSTSQFSFRSQCLFLSVINLTELPTTYSQFIGNTYSSKPQLETCDLDLIISNILTQSQTLFFCNNYNVTNMNVMSMSYTIQHTWK